MQDGAAVTGLAIAAASLVAVSTTGNAIYDPIGSIIVGNLLGMVCNPVTYSKCCIHWIIGKAWKMSYFNSLVEFFFVWGGGWAGGCGFFSSL